jgi:hypothetical protein
MTAINKNYYLSQKTKMLRRFDKIAKIAKLYLIKYDEEAFAVAVIEETREKFEQIIPELPYIGGNQNQFTPVMIINGWIISFFRVMTAHGKTTEEVIRICCDVADDYMRSLPRFLLWAAGNLAFGRFIHWKMRKQARQSLQCQYPDDFVYKFVEGDGNDFDWALEFSECAVNKFYEKQGVEELKPYCNFFDVTYSRYLNMGIDASMTIGMGCLTCKLKYKRGRETKAPELLRTLLP